MHGGDPLARTGEVLALVPLVPSAGPAQDQGLRGIVSPLETGTAKTPVVHVLDETDEALISFKHRRGDVEHAEAAAVPIELIR